MLRHLRVSSQPVSFVGLSIALALMIEPILSQGAVFREESEDRVPYVRQVQDANYRLDFKRAEAVAGKMLEAAPEDPVGYAMLAITKWNILLQAASNTALDDYATPTPFTKNRTYKVIAAQYEDFARTNRRLEEISLALQRKDPDSVKARYFEGLAYENISGAEFAVRKDRGAGLNAGKKAVNIHKDVLNRDPEFVDALLSVGTSEFARATLPWTLRWLAFLLGYGGDKEEGLAKIKRVAEDGTYRPQDALVVMALLQAWKGDAGKAVQIFAELGQRFPENYLLDINRAAILEMVLEDRKAALTVYKELLENLGSKAPGLSLGEVHYRIGRTYFSLNEYSPALESFKKGLESACREAETRPLCHFYMAQIHEEQGDRERARENYRKVLDYNGPKQVLEEERKEAAKKVR